ncbi:MAG: hypothetical protein JRI63_13330 [Deltaproteobacteria bacterium]|nr:hypothetical protein [Deltaproteobacteria bacterium]
MPKKRDDAARENQRLNRFGLYSLILRDRLNLSRNSSNDFETHIREAVNWLCRAQDGTPDDGFARAYNLATGWEPSYPETTGYIIPTLLDYYHLTGKDEILHRSIKAADWLLKLQFPEGGIPAGTVATEPKIPTIFNTGQVIFGWVSAYKESGNSLYLEAIRKACDWLVETQDDDGAWRKYGSFVSTYALNTYNTRTAWAVLQGGRLLDSDKYQIPAVKNIEWALTQMNDKGWFDNDCLIDNSKPLTHTIAYTIRGILEIGLAVKNERFINSAIKSASMVLNTLHPNGFLPGRLDCNWTPKSNYNCLTGACQMAIIWLRLYNLNKDMKFFNGAQRAIKYACSTQDLKTSNMGVKGGIKGSFPINGEYGKFEYLNWAAKFFVDALLAYDIINHEHKECSN